LTEAIKLELWQGKLVKYQAKAEQQTDKQYTEQASDSQKEQKLNDEAFRKLNKLEQQISAKFQSSNFNNGSSEMTPSC